MRTKAFDHLRGASVERGGVFDRPSPRTMPGGVSGWLRQYGLSVDELYRHRQRLTVAQVDQHFASRAASPSDRMSVKSTLRQFGLLNED